MHPQTHTPPRWALDDLLDSFGTYRQVQHELFLQTGQTVPIQTIGGWHLRCSIPVDWALVLVSLALKRGHIKTIDALKTSRPKYRRKSTAGVRRRRLPVKPEWAGL